MLALSCSGVVVVSSNITFGEEVGSSYALRAIYSCTALYIAVMLATETTCLRGQGG